MAARIRSLRNGIDPVDETSRDDLISGDVVTVTSIDGASTYNWTLVYVPEGSLATFSGSATAMSPGSFTVDLVGPYLVRLVVDAGLGTEDVQYVRLRALTTKLGLCLVAAGERRDGTGIIPVDVDPTGWADEQNKNLQLLEDAIGSGGAPDDQYMMDVVVSPNNTVSNFFFAPYDLTLVKAKVYAHILPTTTGNYTLALTDDSTATNLLAAATFDMTSLVAQTLTPLTLTPTTGNLDMPEGTRIKYSMASDNGDLVAGGVYVQLIYRSQ